MPIYEYECSRCGKIMDVLQKISEPPLAHCHHCGGPVTKLMSRTTFHLKGSGWYVTDYAGSKSAASPAGPEPEAASPPPAAE